LTELGKIDLHSSRSPIQLVDPKRIRFGPYQPAHRRENVKDLIPFDEDLVGVLELSFRDGELYALEGQRRITAAIQDQYPDKLLCFVRFGLTEQAEGRVWRGLNQKAPQTAVAFYNSAVIAGYPEIALVIHRELSQRGFTIEHNYGPKAISAVKVVEVLALWDSLGTVLDVISAAWPDHENATLPDVLMALGSFDLAFAALEGDDLGVGYDEQLLIDALRRRDPGALWSQAKEVRGNPGSMYVGPSSWSALAALMHRDYNLLATRTRGKSACLPPYRASKVPSHLLQIARVPSGRAPKKQQEAKD